MKKLLGGVVAFGWCALIGCTVATQPEALSEGCPEGTKACDGVCVSTNDEEFGCGRASCSPCALVNSVAGCSAEGECIIASCVGSWEDCDRDPLTGCEVNLDRDPAHCGSCDSVCEPPSHGEAACAEAACYVRVCEEPYSDCNFDVKDGCEVDLASSNNHCGDCGVRCDADEECLEGECRASASD